MSQSTITPCTKSAETFSKKELSALLSTAGLPFQDWYYPFPDYKFPQTVLFGRRGARCLRSIWDLCPVQALGIGRREVINERLLGKTLASAGLFSEFANSFLVIARKAGITRHRRECLRFWASSKSKRQFAVDAMICRQGDEMCFVKTPSGTEAVAFLGIVKRREEQAANFFNGKVFVVRGKDKRWLP